MQLFRRRFRKRIRVSEHAGFSLNESGGKSFAMQVLKAGLDKSMFSYLLRHQDPRMMDHYEEFRTKPLKGALDTVRDFNGFASSLTEKTG